MKIYLLNNKKVNKKCTVELDIFDFWEALGSMTTKKS